METRKKIAVIVASLAAFVSFALAGAAMAVNVTVPAAPGNGYALVSTSTGAYVASTTDPFHVGSLFGTSTATSTLNGGINLPNKGCFAIASVCVGSNTASSTLLGDNNTFTGNDSFTNASSNFSGTWQTFSPSHFATFGYPYTTQTNFGSTVQATGTIAYFTAGLQASSSVQFGNGNASNLTWDSANGALDLGTFSSLASTPLRISTTTNNFIQALIQNLSTGNNASADLVFGNNKDSTAATYFADIGIDGGGYTQAGFNSENAGDAFFSSSDGAVVISTASSTNNLADIRFATQGTASSSIRMVISAAGKVGIASTSPQSTLSVGTGTASSSVTIAEYKYGATGNVATSTTANLDCAASNQVAWPIGTSATTLTLINMIPGKKCIVVVQNPNAAAGALTWAVPTGYVLKWAGGTTPTQTTTANAIDIWSFLDTMASSSQEIIGAATLNN